MTLFILLKSEASSCECAFWSILELECSPTGTETHVPLSAFSFVYVVLRANEVAPQNFELSSVGMIDILLPVTFEYSIVPMANKAYFAVLCCESVAATLGDTPTSSFSLSPILHFHVDHFYFSF